jgi:hypothetical protein
MHTSSQTAHTPISELILSDRMITLAQEADRAGLRATAEQLVSLACAVFDEATKRALPYHLT